MGGANEKTAEWGARARAVLSALDAQPEKMAQIGADVAKLAVFRKFARCDLWIVDPEPQAELQLTVRGADAADALAEMRLAVSEIWPEGAA